MMQEASDVNNSKGRKMSSNYPKVKPSEISLFSFRNFDLYTKIDDDYKVQTSGGATLSIAGWVLIAVLVIGQINGYLSPKLKEHMVVDTTLGQKLRVNLNITFHALTCDEVHLDAMDVAGDNQLNIEHEMTKQRISATGALLGLPFYEKVNKPNEHRTTPVIGGALDAANCMSCFGAESALRSCCNSCDDLKNAYKEKGWSTIEIVRTAPQCHDEMSKKHDKSLGKGEGCQIAGLMTVNKVAGNFHVAHGESIVRDGHHIHQFIPAEAPGFNVSHTINSLSFGAPFRGMKRPNPLNGVTRMCPNETGTGLFQYFIKVLPTSYSNQYGGKALTSQYSFTERFRPLAMPGRDGGGVLPGIFFVYEMSPFMIEVQEDRVPLMHLITKLFAIVGGVFTVLGVVDAVFFKLQKLLKIR